MPKNIYAAAVNWNSIQVTWTPLDRKEEVTSYEVKYCSINCSTIEVYENSVLLKGLPQYTSFTIKVRGRNAKYAGPWKVSRELQTLGQYNYLVYYNNYKYEINEEAFSS